MRKHANFYLPQSQTKHFDIKRNVKLYNLTAQFPALASGVVSSVGYTQSEPEKYVRKPASARG
jgi:hypothetical protein